MWNWNFSLHPELTNLKRNWSQLTKPRWWWWWICWFCPFLCLIVLLVLISDWLFTVNTNMYRLYLIFCSYFWSVVSETNATIQNPVYVSFGLQIKRFLHVFIFSLYKKDSQSLQKHAHTHIHTNTDTHTHCLFYCPFLSKQLIPIQISIPP